MSENLDAEDQGVRVRRGRRAPFKQLPDDVVDDDTISPEAKVTYWYLKRIADYDDDNAIVSMGKIAYKLGRAKSNRRAARGWVDELITAGWVETHQRKSSIGGDLATEFVVHDLRAHPPVGERWSPGGGGLRVKGERVNQDPGGGGSTVTPPGDQTRRGEGVVADPLSSRSGFTLDVSSSKNSVEADASTATAPRGDAGDATVRDLFGTPQQCSSKTRGSTRQPKPRTGLDERVAGSAQQVVAAWVDAYKVNRVRPAAQRVKQVGREAKELLAAGNDLDGVIKAAESAARQGYATIDREFSLLAAAAVGNAGRSGGDRRGSGHQPYRDTEDESMFAQSLN